MTEILNSKPFRILSIRILNLFDACDLIYVAA